MSQITNNPMPIRTSPELHHAKLLSLNTLKEDRTNRGCKNDLSNYVNWLYSKVNLYESYTDAYNKVIDGSQVRSVEEYVNNANMDIVTQRNSIQEQIRRANEELSQLRDKIQSANKTLTEIEEKEILESVGYYDYDNPASASVYLKQQLDLLKQQIKDMQNNKTAINAANNFTFNNSLQQGRKFTADFSTLMLTAYNQEVENAIVKLDKTRSMDVAIKRLEKAKSRVAKLGTLMQASINEQFHQLRIREVSLAFQFKDMEIARKEKEKEEKERLAEEARVLKEAEKAREEAEKKVIEKKRELNALLSYQQQHYTNVVGSLNPSNPKVEELKAQIAELEKAKNEATERLANTKAGYVYVISNIGSFGEGVVKIGLTRRLNPDDRVKELSSASVPFIFDTHAIHFSEDAVGLERKLHQRFNDRRVNKINLKKEYFRVTLDEVKQALLDFSGDGATLRFTDEAVAADYRKSVTL